MLVDEAVGEGEEECWNGLVCFAVDRPMGYFACYHCYSMVCFLVVEIFGVGKVTGSVVW